jgi:hypothetical protein
MISPTVAGLCVVTPLRFAAFELQFYKKLRAVAKNTQRNAYIPDIVSPTFTKEG